MSGCGLGDNALPCPGAVMPGAGRNTLVLRWTGSVLLLVILTGWAFSVACESILSGEIRELCAAVEKRGAGRSKNVALREA